eukprot:1157779-Pelagomonas_calceolata.AAC.15
MQSKSRNAQGCHHTGRVKTQPALRCVVIGILDTEGTWQARAIMCRACLHHCFSYRCLTVEHTARPWKILMTD